GKTRNRRPPRLRRNSKRTRVAGVARRIEFAAGWLLARFRAHPNQGEPRVSRSRRLAASNRSARIWVSRSGLHLAGPGPSATVRRRCRSFETRAPVAKRLRLGLGNESAQNRGRDPEIGRNLERTFRTVKKALITALQLAVTITLLIWVFHDPEQRHKMGKALHEADYRWVLAAIVAYLV